MKNSLGVVQGRLLPKYKGRYQAHPVGYWQQEFSLAAELGLDCIEFILDFNDAEKNPLLTSQGCKEIKALSDRTGVKVLSVCADYFMVAPLHSENERVSERSTKILRQLLNVASDFGIRDIIIPCVDHSSIKDQQLRERFQEVLSGIVSLAERCGVNLSLETDLEPTQFNELLSKLDSSRVTINYDIGNSASLGYDPEDELNSYSACISDIHIKDRTLGGGPVKLGTGNADIPRFFKLLKRFDYRGPFIMQAYRDDQGVSIFKEQLKWVKAYLE